MNGRNLPSLALRLPPAQRYVLAAWPAAVCVIAIAAGSGDTLAQSPRAIKPNGGSWDTASRFHFDKREKKTRQSVSGIACNLNAAKVPVCLVAFDEGSEARFASLAANKLVAGEKSVKLRGNDGELDAEGAATDGRYFYITGSHSAKRSDCKSNPASRHVIRFRVDPATRQALRSQVGKPGGAFSGYEETGRLWAIMQTLPDLKTFVGERKCLGSDLPPDATTVSGQQGVNIEGLAVKGGRLYFGFRGPVEKGFAKVLAVDTEAFFHAGDPKATVTQMPLGERRGIRDMVSVNSGFLILAGPDDRPSSSGAGWTISWWDGNTVQSTAAPKALAMLDLTHVKLRNCDKEIKPEAITVLEETSKAYRLLVLSDGLCDGGPLEFTVPR